MGPRRSEVINRVDGLAINRLVEHEGARRYNERSALRIGEAAGTPIHQLPAEKGYLLGNWGLRRHNKA